MRPGRILFFSCEPGGAEVLSPVIRGLEKDPAYETTVLGYGYALERFARRGIACIEIRPLERNDLEFIRLFSPDLIVTSATSMPAKDMSEKHLWQTAKVMGIPTIAFLDQWQNYSMRFSGPGSGEGLVYLPDYINCINEIARGEMMREGFPPEILLPLGHPYLSGLSETVPSSETADIRERIPIGDDREVVLFVSEAIEEYYGRTRGYNQHDAIKCFLELASREHPGAAILLKLHPKEDPVNYRYLHQAPMDVKILTDGFTPLECLSVADRVYGMTSLMLIEAYILGRPVVSVQPDLRVEDPLVLSRYGLVPRIPAPEGCASGPRPGPRQGEFVYDFSLEAFKGLLDHILGSGTRPLSSMKGHRNRERRPSGYPRTRNGISAGAI